MKIVLLSGKAESGKTTSAILLKDMLEKKNKKVLITHYGDLLKYICKSFFMWDGNKDETGRSILQYVGTEQIRAQNPDYWVNFIKSIVSMFPEDWDYILVPDCRFVNEIEAFDNSDHNVYKVRVERLNYENHLTPEQRMHPSETLLDNYDFDYYIKAESGIEKLNNEVIKFYNVLIT